MNNALFFRYRAHARRAGIPLLEYVEKRAAGLKRCHRCREWKPASEHAAGTGWRCKECREILNARLGDE